MAAATTRGLGLAEMETLGECIADLILAEPGPDAGAAVERARSTVARLCEEAVNRV